MKPPAHELCQAIRENLVAFREGDLDGRTSATIQVHLRRCGECRNQWAELGDLDARIALEFVKPDFEERVMRAIELDGRSAQTVWRRPWALLTSALAAAAAIFLIDVQLRPPRLTDATETVSMNSRKARQHDLLTSGRVYGFGAARSLGLPLSLPDGLGKGSRRWAAR
jgi:predicted anti-sigma-YlaC factor YlaD